MRGPATLSRIDLGNEDDLCSCHLIRALLVSVVGCKAFAQCGRGRLVQMMGRFSTARLMMGGENSDG